MNKTILFTILCLLLSISSFAQEEDRNKLVLPMLGLKDKPMEIILTDIDRYIGNKPNGLQYPITKIVFSQLDDLLCYEVVAIDNSWANLFTFGEVPFGYMILNNRLFMIMSSGYHAINLSHIFFMTDQAKTFSRTTLPVPTTRANPTWFFEFRDAQSYLISIYNVDVLN